LWVDVPSRDPEVLGELSKQLGLSKSVTAALADGHEDARLIRDKRLIYLTVVGIEADEDGTLSRHPIDLVAGPSFVLTARDGDLDAIDRFEAIIRGDTVVGQLEGGSFLGVLVDTILSTWFTRIEEVEREIDELDEIALRGPDNDHFLPEVLRLRRRIALIRRTVAPHRETLAPLARPDFELDERLGRPWPGLVDRLERVIDAIENARELIVGSFDIYLGGAAHRSNEVMKALTIVSAILLPAIVLAGVMGMNFKMPFFDELTNFWIVVGVMGAFAAGMLLFARLRRWI
jgi:magnesium/cobalt transport protein CorA